MDIDPWLPRAFAASLGALDRARLSALHSGCFVDAAQHGRYDVSHERTCSTCGVLDTVDHWFRCPRFASLHGGLVGSSDDRAPGLTALLARASLMSWTTISCQLDHRVDDFQRLPGHGVHHLFADGAATRHKKSRLQHGAWALVDSTSGGPLAGRQQGVPSSRQCSALRFGALWVR